MRKPLFESKAPKQTVSLTLNSDLYAKAKSLGINASRVAEEAIGREYAVKHSELLAAEIRQNLEACDKYAEEHGSFADFVREYYDGTV
jgi:post-segregation antitoxin (ccd killing protein)